ncbi:MAG TPA: ComEA family DNA-binding protein [Solirubrobacteraceae bacterium]
MPELPITRAQALALAGVAIAVAVLVGRVLLPAGGAAGAEPAELRVSSAARASPAAAGRASGPGVVVHVVGAVRRPGLYELPAGSRVADALEHAGGAAPAADVALVNLAAPLADGQQVVVPSRAAAGSESPGAAGESGSGGGPVHLNTASVAELDELPGVGPVTAQKIVDHREQHGVFSSVEDLDAIPGIGAAKIEQLRDLVAP